ncbi:metal tolerance protein 3 [Acrodontium crateriforme]|uniref:Metal tolerance protein 3 n=1 Tax=Acrodontium crateriforme TaxID=150365 RepID=A0AAQ3M9G2_9PEZI|nr:metal tolerance protein 3 [Acrodontium crateriforme]
MTHSDPDLHHAITLRPSPFHAHSERVGRTYSPAPAPASPALPDHAPSAANQPATSSAYEADSHDDPVRQRPVFNSRDSGEAECQSLPNYNASQDPYNLSSGIKTSEEIATIKSNTGRKRTAREGCLPGAKSLKAEYKARKLQGFYETQNENIERLLKPVDEHVRLAKEEQGDDALQYKIAVYGSFAANVLLAILQVYGAVSSGSLSLFTTMADAIFDPCSNLTLILSNRAVNRVDPRRFPSGKARIETAGNITFCFLMTSVSFILIVLSSKELAEKSAEVKFHLPSVVAVAVAFATKLALFLYCWALRNKYSQIRILWEDHRNDLFINGFGLLTSIGGSKLRPWIDPMGAIILSVLISFLWLRTAYSEFQLLIGVSADTAFLQHITYISMTHSPLITGLDTVRAWHSGPRLIVEVDIVMDRQRSLEETHDVAEALQTKLESLPDVERCYVHVDYETSHAPEHFWKKEL